MQLDHLPFQVRRTIQSLFGKPPAVVRGRDEDEQARLRIVKLSKIRFLEDYFISRIAALQGIVLFWKNQAPFCLFLRSFEMGHRAEYTEDEEWLDVSEPSGGRLLSLLADTLLYRPGLPLYSVLPIEHQFQIGLVAIANPDEWLPHRLVRAPFVNLVVDGKDWRGVVDTLIKAAQMIVIHRAEPSPGLDYELEAIRSAGRVGETIVIREPQINNESDTNTGLSGKLAILDRQHQRQEARNAAMAGMPVFSADPALTDFMVFDWWDDEFLAKALSLAVLPLLHKKDVRRIFDALPSIGPPKVPPEELAQFRLDARGAHELAGRCIDAGDFLMAEELLFECFATSCASGDLGGRASACLELGRLFLLRMGNADSARVPLEYASAHFSVLGARDYALEGLHLYAAAHLMCGDSVAAQAILEQAETWGQTVDNRKWQCQLWRIIEAQATNTYITGFAAEVSGKLGTILEGSRTNHLDNAQRRIL